MGEAVGSDQHWGPGGEWFDAFSFGGGSGCREFGPESFERRPGDVAALGTNGGEFEKTGVGG